MYRAVQHALTALALFGITTCAAPGQEAGSASLTTGRPEASYDAVLVAPTHYRVRVDNAYVRVVESNLLPGDKDGLHVHPAGWFYVTSPGTMKIVHSDGKEEMWAAKGGESGWMEAEGPHTSENVGTTPLGFVLVEVKGAQQGRMGTTSEQAKPHEHPQEQGNSRMER